MTKIHCCLCDRRTDTAKQRARIGTTAFWPLFYIHIEKTGLDINQYSRDEYVCMKCHSSISHYGMNDRGPNKKVNAVKPFVFEANITKNVLRNSSKTIFSEKSSNSTDNARNSVDLDSESGTASTATNDYLSSAGPSQSSMATINQSSIRETRSVTDYSVAAVQAGFLSATVLDLSEIDEQATSHSEQYSAAPHSGGEKDTSHNHQSLVTNSSEEQGTSYNHQSSVTDSRQEQGTSHNHQSSVTDSNEEQGTSHDHQSSVTDSSEEQGTSHNQQQVVESGEELATSNNQQSSLANSGADHVTGHNQQDSVDESAEEQASSHNQQSNVNAMHLQGVKTTQSRCFICHSVAGRKAIPWTAIQQAWFEKLTYIPKSNRICKDHLTSSNKFDEEALQKIEDFKQDVFVINDEFGKWLRAISDLPKSTLYNFEEDGIEADKYRMFLGISKDNFDDLVQYLHGMRNTTTRSVRTALAMFLMLLRNNMKQDIIAFNFFTTQQVVSSTINAVSAALEEYFVPKYLGYYHITREEALQKHSIKLTSKILGQSEDRLCLIADCTYNYIEKPSDFELQRKTFSLHKSRNLLKPLYIVLPSGYILEAAGPYYCDARNNDAANIHHHYRHSDLLLFLEEDDFFIFDRGFRDVVKETTDNGHNVMMPALLGGKRTHFTCIEANESRKVTMNRWVVEAVNARIKNVFPFFRHTIEGSYVPKIMRFNRIACAIINCYFPPLFKDKDFHDIILEESTNLIANTNPLKEEIERLCIQRMTARWEKATDTSVPDFPELSMEDLKRLTLGIYQIRIAERYIDHHMKGDKNFGIFIHLQHKGIIRAKIQSRFSRSKAHNAWVKYDCEEVSYTAIKGLYCTCKVGERSLGCCSHLTSVVRYLGYDRHQPEKVTSRSAMPWDAIDCYEEELDDCLSSENGDDDSGNDSLPSEDEVIDLNCCN